MRSKSIARSSSWNAHRRTARAARPEQAPTGPHTVGWMLGPVAIRPLSTSRAQAADLRARDTKPWDGSPQHPLRARHAHPDDRSRRRASRADSSTRVDEAQTAGSSPEQVCRSGFRTWLGPTRSGSQSQAETMRRGVELCCAAASLPSAAIGQEAAVLGEDEQLAAAPHCRSVADLLGCPWTAGPLAGVRVPDCDVAG